MSDLSRTGEATVDIPMPNGVRTTLFATPEVFLDRASIEEIRNFARLQDTLDDLSGSGFFGDIPAFIERIVLTPDFHRGAGIPVGTVFRAHGFVVPKAVGNDVGCGMRLLVTDVQPDEIAKLDKNFERLLRTIFFEGRRDIAMSARLRDGMLRYGLPALIEHPPDTETWRMIDAATSLDDVMRCHAQGGFPSDDISLFDDYVRGSGSDRDELTYDMQIGSIGGGNHFTELQLVEAVVEGPTAHAWGLIPGTLTIMAHSGSVGLGHMVGARFMGLARKIHPAGRRPAHGFDVLPTDGAFGNTAETYLAAMRAAANFAFANRLFLGLMVLRALSERLGRRVAARVVHDAPHNLIWSEGAHEHLHRKGACPALGPETPDPEFPSGHPVIVPGSMGDASWVLRGNGLDASFCSACHGAGRVAPRHEARRVDSGALDRLRIVGRIDPEAPQFRQRPDVVAEFQRSLMEEAPDAYKPITPVIDTIEQAGIASRVARLKPLMTIKS